MGNKLNITQTLFKDLYIVTPNQLHEANLLKLDCSKAHIILNWKAVWDTKTTFEKTVEWYRNYYEDKKILTKKDLENYVRDAKEKKLEWAIK